MFLPGGFVEPWQRLKSRFLSDTDLKSLPATLTGLVMQGAAWKCKQGANQSSWMFGGFLLGTVILSEGTEKRRAEREECVKSLSSSRCQDPWAALPPPKDPDTLHRPSWLAEAWASVCFHCSLQLPCLSIICKGWAPQVSQLMARSFKRQDPLTSFPPSIGIQTHGASPSDLSLLSFLRLFPAPVLPALLLAALLMAFISHLVIYSRLHSCFYTHLTQVFIWKTYCPNWPENEKGANYQFVVVF